MLSGERAGAPGRGEGPGGGPVVGWWGPPAHRAKQTPALAETEGREGAGGRGLSLG